MTNYNDLILSAICLVVILIRKPIFRFAENIDKLFDNEKQNHKL